MLLVVVAAADVDLGGHLKSRGSYQSFPADSLLRDYSGSGAADLDTDLRLKFARDVTGVELVADAQFLALYGDSVEYSRELASEYPGFETLYPRLPEDDRRWWDLTHVGRDRGDTALLARLDRLSAGYTGDAVSVRFGRQALSWGNGVFYSPMDIVNPFDPAQVDTEYKTGDDMFYLQWLRDSGDDLEIAYVVRRDVATGDVESDAATAALKYHGFFGAAEYDLLLAHHYGDPVLALGGGTDVGGAVWRSDLVLGDTGTDGVVAEFVLNGSYSWMWGQRNVSGSVEYYYNGFGQTDGCYSPDCLSQNPELLQRVARGQLYTLGRHYIGASMTVEMTPLFTLTPNLFWNLSDGSALLQLVSQNSLGDNLVLLGMLAAPLGPDGTEFGGIDSGVADTWFSSDLSAFIQLGWYF